MRNNGKRRRNKEGTAAWAEFSLVCKRYTKVRCSGKSLSFLISAVCEMLTLIPKSSNIDASERWVRPTVNLRCKYLMSWERLNSTVVNFTKCTHKKSTLLQEIIECILFSTTHYCWFLGNKTVVFWCPYSRLFFFWCELNKTLSLLDKTGCRFKPAVWAFFRRQWVTTDLLI